MYGFEMAGSDDGGVGYDGYDQVGGHASQPAEWEGWNPPMKGQEGPSQAQKYARYIKSASRTKVKKNLIPGQL